jgi:hypothetical protein
MEKQEMKGHYGYDVKEAYSKFSSLEGKPIIFKDSRNDYPYISARLQGAEIIKIQNSEEYAVIIGLEAPVIESKEKPTSEQILGIINSYEMKSPEERRKIQEKSDPFLSILSQTSSLEEKLKEVEKIPRWNFLERRKMRKKIASEYVSAVGPNILKPLKITKPEDLPPWSIDYGGTWQRKIFTKEEVETLEEVSI